MLKKTLLFTAAFLFLIGTAYADFLDDYRAAEKLQKNRKFQEAAASYEKLGKKQKDASLFELCILSAAKSLAAGRKFEEALEVSKAIKTQEIREYAQMHAYNVCGKKRQLKDVFKDTDISKWPDEYAYLGYFMRGSASPRAAGLKDLESALAACGSDQLTKEIILRELGERYVMLGRNAQAHAVLDRLIAEGTKGRIQYQAAVRTKAVLLAKEKKFDAADKMLARLNNAKEKLQQFWNLITKAKIETFKGNRTEAEKLYDTAFAMKGVARPIINFQKIEAGRTFPKYKEKK